MMVRWTRAAVVVVAVVASTSSMRAAAQGCTGFADEPTCEAAEGCYWADFRTEPKCESIPTTNAGCECRHSSNTCSDQNSGPEGGGCYPQRFCVPQPLGGCKVVLKEDVKSDNDCREDGTSSCRCVPSEFCERSSIWDSKVCDGQFLSIHCFIKKNKTDAPTAGPTLPTPLPSRRPTGSPVENRSDEAGVDPLIIGGAVGGLVVILASIGFCFCVSRTKETQALRGVITADEYLQVAKPPLPEHPQRQTLDKELLAPDAEGMRLLVLFDFEAENEDELDVRKGEEILGLLRYDEWWEARTQDGIYGIIPTSYVDEIGLTEGVVDEDNLRADEDIDF